MKRYIQNRIQIKNPKSKLWTKINTLTGQIIGKKKTPYKKIRKI